MNQPGKKLSKVTIALILIAFLAFLPIFLTFWPNRTTLQSLDSLDDKHTAKLVRTDAIDRNYHVYVDGERVYGSPDFAPRRDISFREALFWDESGKVLVLEVAGQRIFGYEVDLRRRLSDEELLAVEAFELPLWEYHFESEWPGIGRVRRPNGWSAETE